MNSDTPEVSRVLSVLLPHLDRSCGEMSARALEDVLSGVASMTSRCAGVRALLGLVSKKIASTDKLSLGARNLGKILSTLRGMSSDVPEVRSLLYIGVDYR